MGGQNEWNGEDIAEQIRRALSQALDFKDFDQLNRTISNTVDSALSEARQQFERYRNRAEKRSGEPVDSRAADWVTDDGGAGRVTDDGGAGRVTAGTAAWQSTYSAEPYAYGGRTQAPENTSYRVKWKGRISGFLMSAAGAFGTSAFGMLTFLMLTMSLIAINGAAGWIITLFLALMTGGFGLLLWAGVSRFGRVHRLKIYLDEVRRTGRPYCEVGRLGRAAGRSESFAKKDLKKILEMGMLPDARMDEEGTYLMMNAETYRQYEMLQESLRNQREQERLAKEQKEAAARAAKKAGEERTARTAAPGQEKRAENGSGNGSENEAVMAAVARGEEQMEILDQMRRSLPPSAMTDKLVRLDRVLERLFATLRKYPDQLDELERFMEYYLPTTVKLVTAYKEFSAVEFPGDNINSAKREIEKTMDTINGAFEKLLDDMYEDTAFDVMTDASVLQTVLKREGLTDGDFEVNRKHAGGEPEADKKKSEEEA